MQGSGLLRWFRRSLVVVLAPFLVAIVQAPVAWAAAPVILVGENNQFPNVCQGAFGVTWLASAITSKFAPPTVTGQAVKFGADTSAYGANIALKLCPPSIVAPETVRKHPEPGTCGARFRQSVVQGEYKNWNGIPTSYLFNAAKDQLGRPTWGELGNPLVYHFNTSADVRLIDPDKEGALDDAWLPDADGNLLFPVGVNTAIWRADTMMDITDLAPLFLIPLVAPGDQIAKKLVMKNRRLSETVYVTYGRLTRWGDGGTARRVISKIVLNVAKEQLEQLPQTAVEAVLGQIPIFQWRTETVLGIEAANRMGQEVWVYDTVPPTLVTNKSPGSFPTVLQPLMTYDPLTDTYYLEAYAPRIAESEIAGLARQLLIAGDECQGERPPLEPFRVDGGFRNAWLAGDEATLQWQVADSGPNLDGDVNLSPVVSQKIILRDSNPPILIAPPSRVVEIELGLTSVEVPLGSPRIFDLVDLSPTIGNDAPGDGKFNLGINTVNWTATDYSGNSAGSEQLINVKIEGTNNAPVAADQTVNTVSSVPTTIILNAFDPDFDVGSGRYDPLSFTIRDRPQHGFFIAPLLPYFIDDYRLEANALRFAGQLDQEDPGEYCDRLDQGTVTGPDQYQMLYPYSSEYFNVDDDGTTVVYDQGSIRCQFGDMSQTYRLAAFDANGDLLHHRETVSTLTDIYIDWRTKAVYALDNPDPGDPNRIEVFDKALSPLGSRNVEYISNDGFQERITGDGFITSDHQGIVYVGGKGAGSNAVVAYEGPAIADGYRFIGVHHEDSNMRDIAVDSANSVYISKPDRILKFAPSTLDDDGDLVPGALLGWMGRCTSNLDPFVFACDVDNERSIGYSCTDALCGTTGNNFGAAPVQFNDARGIAIDPNDILYVSDYGNSRVQRFTPDGDFAGQAVSTGVGYGFILGDFGRPEDITVNSDHFYILNRNLLHVLQTTPVTPIDDDSAMVTYQSENNFVGTDAFTFEATDGLASDTGTVTVNVERNFRPPVISVPPTGTVVDEDGEVVIQLTGADPDGELDVLSYIIVEPPRHGSLGGSGQEIVYTPNVDYYGEDSFLYKVSDGVFESGTAAVHIVVNPVEDTPEIRVEAEVEEGLGFRFQFPVEVYDPDEDESLMVAIDWGDGSEIVESGVVLREGVVVTDDFIQADGTIPEDLEITGPLIDLSPDGSGSVIFEHAYASEGEYTAMICVSDRMETLPDGARQMTAGTTTACSSTTFIVALSTELIMVVNPEDEFVDPGTNRNVTIEVTSRPFDIEVPENPAGIDAINLVVSGEAGSNLALMAATPGQGACSLPAAGAFTCSLGTLAFGATTSVSVVVAVDALAPANAFLTVVANREADAIAPLEEEAIGVLIVSDSDLPPQVQSLSRVSGSTSGGDTLTVSGEAFDADAVVLFDGLPANSIDIVDARTITLTTPARIETGTVDVIVVNGDEQFATLAAAFTYIVGVDTGGGGGNDTGGGNGSDTDTPANPRRGGGGSADLFSLATLLLALLLALASPLAPLRKRRGESGVVR